MRVLVATACVVALAGCSDGQEATVTVSELPSIVLQPADLPRAYVRFDEGKQARLDSKPGPRQDPARFDRRAGWKARFHRPSRAAGGPGIVESRADVFEKTGGAKKDLDAYREELERGVPGSGATPKLLEAPDLGDKAVAGELRQGPLVFITVAWRKANATASVTVTGPTAQTRLGDAVALARRQARRLDRAARA